ncbi:hypothetical protein KSF_107550 [Reticulibacter mediterranei]|uniref:Uncharacterized protein n=1 Tax=Reticulibacter mediterranei TaxID=2778369 RepID=A0A8J3J1M9_9CHLR|nr:hypothetical protein [Reticulibacter mediterranei]GHP00708.1 hypothetical protein KSF_107550 [Reticulibacter mediterranei]
MARQDWKAVLRQWLREQRAQQARERIQSIAILEIYQLYEYIPEVDPHWDDPRPWHDAARGDGLSYRGVIEWVNRHAGEDLETFHQRVQSRADWWYRTHYAQV